MGAQDFMVIHSGRNAVEAFGAAVEEAKYEYGHGGYTGTIAEKRGFRVIHPPLDRDESGRLNKREVIKWAEDILYDAPELYAWVDDKWGDAACIDLGPISGPGSNHRYLFFGYASS